VTARSATLRLLLFLSLGLGLAPAASAEGRVKRGVRAPPFDVIATSGSPRFSLDAARGRFVFLEFFSVDCKHCQRFVPRMNQIHRRYAQRGLVVVGVTREGMDKVRAFRHRYKTQYRIVSAHLDVQVEYGVEAYPTAFLLAPNGRTLWRGNPDRMQERVLDAYLRKFPVLPAPTGRFLWVSEAVREGRFADARSRLERHRQCLSIRADECRFVLGALDWLEGYARSSLEAAKRDEDAGRLYDAWWTYEHLVSGYTGTTTAVAAGARRAALLSDPAREREIKAHADLVAARLRARRLAPGAGVQALRAIALTHPGTRAAQAAQTLAAGWRKRPR